jgi:hypothetical protein
MPRSNANAGEEALPQLFSPACAVRGLLLDDTFRLLTYGAGCRGRS